MATVEWKKVSFEDWWEEKKFEEISLPELEFVYTLPSINFSSCTDDTWQSTFVGTPSARTIHTAVWTGSEMIVWGGYDGTLLNTGGRYCASSCPLPSAFNLITPPDGATGISTSNVLFDRNKWYLPISKSRDNN